MRMTNKEITQRIKREASKVGLTFKVNPNLKFNSAPSYRFVKRYQGEIVLDNCTLYSAYEMVLSGYISSWNGDRFTFKESDAY